LLDIFQNKTPGRQQLEWLKQWQVSKYKKRMEKAKEQPIEETSRNWQAGANHAGRVADFVARLGKGNGTRIEGRRTKGYGYHL